MLLRSFLVSALIIIAATSHVAAQQLVKQEYFDNGNLRLSVYKDGKSFRYITYYESGKIMETGRFTEGRRNGKFERWFENGVRNVNISFSRNSKNGNYSVWDENGRLLLEANYTNGTLLNGSIWDTGGNLLAAR